MIPELIAALQNANLEVTAEEIAEMLWLSLHMAHAHKVETTNSLDQGAEPLKLPEAPLPIDMTSPLQQLQAQPPQPSSKSEAVSNVHLHSQRPADMSNTQHPGLLFKSPAAPALPGSLSLARALRPLMRRLPSRTAFIFNERASVRLIAETHKKIWAPVLDAAPTRWFEVALVIDEGASMILWQQTIAELHTLLERQGAFRDVRVWRLATDTKDRVQINAGASSATKPQQARNPKELVDPTGRRLILVVTDCVSPAWHSGKVQEVLAMWGQKNVVTLVQMLPQRLWPRTSLCAANIVRVRASSPGVANARMKLSRSEQRQGEQSIPIPVVTLEQRSLAIWARMIMGKEGNWVSGAIFDKDTNSLMDDYPDTNQDKDSLTPKKRVQRFQKAASPLACKLAALLAATPISLPVIRLIQQIMLPESNQVHVAEILLGGLLEEIYPDENVIHPDYIEYDFLPGVRDELLNAISMPDAFQVLREVSAFIGSRYGISRDFYARAATPISTEGLSIDKQSRPFAHITAKVWRRLGGEYASLADRLEQLSTSEHGTTEKVLVEDDPNTANDDTFYDQLDSFTDREEMLVLFEQFLRSGRPSQLRVLAIKGNTGTGKTFLMEYLIRRFCPAEKWQTGQINFGQSSILDFQSIFVNLEDAYENCVPTKTLQLYRTKRDQLFRRFDEDRASIIIRQSGDNDKDASLSNITQTVQVSTRLRERELQLRTELMSTLFDLAKESRSHLCLFIDNYERLAEANPEVAHWLWAELLPGLAKADPQLLRVVTCGWEWPSDTAIMSFTQNVELFDFNLQQVKNYLEKRGIASATLQSSQESEELIGAFYELSKGNPLILGMTASYFSQLSNPERTASSLRANRSLLDERARLDFLQERLLSHLSEPYRTLFERGPVLRYFDLPTLQVLINMESEVGTAISRLDELTYSRFLRYPFIDSVSVRETSLQDNQYGFQGLVRRLQIEALRRHHLQTKMQLNRIMAEYYRTSEKSVPKQDAKWLMEMLEREFRSLVEWLYHSLQVAETQEAAFEEWDRLTGWAVERRNRSRAEQLLELARQLTEESEPYLSSSTAAYGRYLIRYTKFLVQEAHLEDARKLLEQARQIFEKVNSSSNLAICFNNIGGIFQIQGKSDQALRYYEQAIQLDPTNVVFRKNRDNLSKSYQGSEGHQWRSSPISRTSVFILGNPGSGKSTAAHMIQMFARDYGWESTLFQDYPILNEMFHADTKVPRFKPTEHGGFDVLDWSVLDEALRILENKVQQFRANLSYERKTLITIEFSRSDYRHAFLNFSPDFLHDTHFLFLDTDIEVCKQRIYERIINPKYEDDVFVSERVFEDYYRNDNRSYMIFGLKQDFHIDDRQVTVIDNTGTQEYLYKQVRSLIDPLFEGWGDITQNEEPLIL